MNLRLGRLLSIATISVLMLPFAASLPAHAQFGGSGQGNPFKAPQATVHAPRARTYHVRHLKLNFAIDGAKHSARGTVTLYLSPLQDALGVVAVDAGSNLKVNACKLNGVDAPFKHEGETLSITPASALSARKEVAVEVQYEMPAGARGGGANGAGGFTWINATPNDPSRRPGFWTQGETETNHKWVPCFDAPNDKCTSETHTTVQEDWTVIGNGIEMPTTADPAHHTKTYHWVMKQPHSTYLLSLAGGELDVVKTQWSGVPVYYAVPKGMGGLAETTFGHTPDMLAFFSTRFGYKYPWAKYAQVCVFDFPGGMENVSATTLGPPGMMIDGRSDHSRADSLISHELGHQWFGDLVTCNDWGDVWLNEGFATFCEMIYTEHAEGKDAYEQDRMRAFQGYLFEMRRYKRSLSTNLYTVGDAMFGQGQTYSRGGLTLHMLRKELGDAVFFGGLSKYLKANQFQPVATSNLIQSMSEVAGKDLKPWFDQWVFKPGHPVVDWSWTYDEAGKYTVLHVKQTQDLFDGTPIYHMPVKVAILLPSGTSAKSSVVETTVTFDRAAQEIRIPGAIKPDSVIIDPEHDVFMETKTAGPAESELASQLKWAPSYQDRLRAARKIASGDKAKDEDTLKSLASVLPMETSDYVATALINILADSKRESFRPLFRTQASSKQLGRRAAAISALGALHTDKQDVAVLRQTAMSDVEPYAVVEPALRSLGRVDAAGNMDVFQHQIDAKSSRDRLANTVVTLLGEAKLEAAVPVLLKAVGSTRSQFLRRDAIRAIGTFAAQNAYVHTALIDALKSDSQPFVQSAAIDALKSRKDTAAIEALRNTAANAKDSSVRTAAEDAVTELSGK